MRESGHVQNALFYIEILKSGHTFYKIHINTKKCETQGEGLLFPRWFLTSIQYVYKTYLTYLTSLQEVAIQSLPRL